jgi:hypothetical protein
MSALHFLFRVSLNFVNKLVQHKLMLFLSHCSWRKAESFCMVHNWLLFPVKVTFFYYFYFLLFFYFLFFYSWVLHPVSHLSTLVSYETVNRNKVSLSTLTFYFHSLHYSAPYIETDHSECWRFCNSRYYVWWHVSGPTDRNISCDKNSPCEHQLYISPEDGL